MQPVPGGLETNLVVNADHVTEPSTPTTNKTGSTTDTDHHIKPKPFPVSKKSLDVTEDENMPTKKGRGPLETTQNETKEKSENVNQR